MDSVDRDTLSQYALAVGNIEIISILTQGGFFEGKTVADLISRDSARFVPNEIFEWLIDNYSIASSDREYTDFLRLLIEAERISPAIKLVAIKEDKRSIDFNQLLFSVVECVGWQFVESILLGNVNVDVNAKNEYGWTVLHFASMEGHLDTVKDLIEKCHCDVNTKDRYGWTPLHCASRWGNLDIVKYLVEECHCDVSAKDDLGCTALHCASREGGVDIVKYLVEECNCDVSIKNKQGEAPLHCASRCGDLGIVKYLVEECNCDVSAKDKNKRTPLYIASEDHHLDIVKYLVEECNCDVNAKDEDGYTPLHRAAQFGRSEIVKYLVEERHCDVKARTKKTAKAKKGQTASSIASKQGYFDIAKYLREMSSGAIAQGN